MSSRNSSRRRLESLLTGESCRTPGTPGPHFDVRQIDRKTLQLCRQVERALNYALGSCENDVLADLRVDSVEPAPNASHLLVTVSPLNPELRALQILPELQRASGYIRSEIATSIHRKRVPELSFRCQFAE